MPAELQKGTYSTEGNSSTGFQVWSCAPQKCIFKCFAELFNLAPSESHHFGLCKTHQKKERPKTPRFKKKRLCGPGFEKPCLTALAAHTVGAKGQTHVTALSPAPQRHNDRKAPQNHPDPQDPSTGMGCSLAAGPQAGGLKKQCLDFPEGPEPGWVSWLRK